MCSMMHYLMPHHIYRDKFVVRNPDELLLCTEYVLVLLYLKLLPNFGKSFSSPTPSRLVLPWRPQHPSNNLSGPLRLSKSQRKRLSYT